jgi:hypothetical protein
MAKSKKKKDGLGGWVVCDKLEDGLSFKSLIMRGALLAVIQMPTAV